MERTYSDSVAARLQSKTRRCESGCLEFTGARNRAGYGRLSRGPKGAGYEGAHRVAWWLANGEIPQGVRVLHRCDNPPCVNPEHLFLGSQSDNVADMWAKGRQGGQLPAGAAHPSAVLSDEQVAALRADAPRLGNYAALGRTYGISKQHARSLALGTSRACHAVR